MGFWRRPLELRATSACSKLTLFTRPVDAFFLRQERPFPFSIRRCRRYHFPVVPVAPTDVVAPAGAAGPAIFTAQNIIGRAPRCYSLYVDLLHTMRIV